MYCLEVEPGRKILVGHFLISYRSLSRPSNTLHLVSQTRAHDGSVRIILISRLVATIAPSFIVCTMMSNSDVRNDARCYVYATRSKPLPTREKVVTVSQPLQLIPKVM
jgi:hypothetical protein